MTTTFWIGFLIGASTNALLVCAFVWWEDVAAFARQKRADASGTHATNRPS